jgi:hypothetical protein
MEQTGTKPEYSRAWSVSLPTIFGKEIFGFPTTPTTVANPQPQLIRRGIFVGEEICVSNQALFEGRSMPLHVKQQTNQTRKS